MADVVFGDAWIDPEQRDGRGTSVVLVRSADSDEDLRALAEAGQVDLQRLPLNRLVESQSGTIRERQLALGARVFANGVLGQSLPKLRPYAGTLCSFIGMRSLLRQWVSNSSSSLWERTGKGNTPSALESFHRRMNRRVRLLRIVERASNQASGLIAHLRRKGTQPGSAVDCATRRGT